MKTSTKSMFMMMMIMSTIMVISSNSWINMWVGLEINLMSFIPMMSSPKNKFLSQSTMSYFLVQSMASMIFIISMMMNKYLFIIMNSNTLKIIIMITMMIKMGMPPFHMWFPEIMMKMSWTMCFILMTWQKIAPIYIMSMMIEMNTPVTLVICLSALMGAIGGMNQISTQKIMAYSSINHMSWMVACASMFKKSWIIYMIIYTLMMGIMSMMMHKYNFKFINQMNIFSTKTMEKIILIIMMMSIGGLPPFLGFLPKWIAIQYMISSKEFLLLMVMTSSSLITLAYYLRMTSSMNLILSHSQKWMFLMKTTKMNSMSILMLNLSLPMLVFFMNFY